MATFGNPSFDVTAYDTFRPTYPEKLFEDIFDYHRSSGGDTEPGRWDLAVDLGCGTGQATFHLGSVFNQVVGIDPSEGMLQAARSKLESSSCTTQFRFIKGDSSDLRAIEDESADLIISATACHWFDWHKAWRECSRILRSGGTIAHFSYGGFRLQNYSSTTSIITAYVQGILGNYFEQPGRKVLENLLVEIPDPPIDIGLSRFERRYYCGPHFPPRVPPSHQSRFHPIILVKMMRWRDLLGYIRTFSGLYNYLKKFPEDLSRVDERFPEDLVEIPTNKTRVRSEVETAGCREDVDVSGGDISIRLWKDLREEVKKCGGEYGVNDLVKVEWPVALILAKKV